MFATVPKQNHGISQWLAPFSNFNFGGTEEAEGGGSRLVEGFQPEHLGNAQHRLSFFLHLLCLFFFLSRWLEDDPSCTCVVASSHYPAFCLLLVLLRPPWSWLFFRGVLLKILESIMVLKMLLYEKTSGLEWAALLIQTRLIASGNLFRSESTASVSGSHICFLFLSHHCTQSWSSSYFKFHV